MSNLKDINVELLIDSVFRKIPLWDQQSLHHHNRYVLDKLWDEVADEMKSSRDIVRTKWKTLRDTFRKELKKIKRSGDSEFESSWQYFDNLQFLNNQFTVIRTNSGNHRSTIQNEADDATELTHWNTELLNDFNSTEIDSKTMISGADLLTNQNADHSIQKRLKLKRQNDLGSTVIRIEEEKPKSLEKPQRNDYDEDESFFNSLLPHIRTLSQQKKMLLRMKMQELVYNFVYEGHQQSNQAAPLKKTRLQSAKDST